MNTFTHDWIWQAIDTLAARKRLSPSGLARLAGLDPTTFNRSKRFTAEGRPRWPSTESISKILVATNSTLDEFAELETAELIDIAPRPFEENTADLATVPVIGEVRGAEVCNLDDHRLRRAFATPLQSGAKFALSIGDRSLEPVYSAGHTLIASVVDNALPGDRLIVKPQKAQAIPCLLLRTSSQAIEFGAFNADRQRQALDHSSIDWIARIIWARQ
jgi:phage repressor protein C with HTH and peptisase S24 domain